MAILSALSTDHFDGIIASSPLVLVDFYADWCEPCAFLDEVLVRLHEKAPLLLEIVKVDIEKHTDLRSSYRIMSVPVLVLFVQGAPVWRMNGFHMEDELLEIIMKFSRETEH